MKKKTISQIQKELWKYCTQIIKKKYGNTCYTCGRTNLEGVNWHTGHFLPKSTCGAFLKYDLRNLRPQCFKCNIHDGGAGAVFYKNMVEREGQEYVDTLFLDRQKSIKAFDHYLMLCEEYKSMLE